VVLITIVLRADIAQNILDSLTNCLDKPSQIMLSVRASVLLVLIKSHGGNEKWMTLKSATSAPVNAASYSCHTERLNPTRMRTVSPPCHALNAIRISARNKEKRYEWMRRREHARKAGRIEEAERLHQAIMARMDERLAVLREEIKRLDAEAAKRNLN
jgi:uncharacterized small protein (DUF1192 family)